LHIRKMICTFASMNTNKENGVNTSSSAVEFLNWCNTPIYRAYGELSFRLRVQPQFPEYNTYIVINETGRSVFPEGKFLTTEELYEYWVSCR
jgi:hypothetical protein